MNNEFDNVPVHTSESLAADKQEASNTISKGGGYMAPERFVKIEGKQPREAYRMIKNITPKLAEAGKIKIGGLGQERKARGGGTYRLPQKYDHFIITKTNRNKAGDLEIDTGLMDGLEPDSDGQVRAIPIMLHSDVIDEVFPTAYALYSGRRCVCRGDGETALRREVIQKQYTGKSKEMECPCSYFKAESGPVCKANGKFFCSITVPGSAIAGAVHAWRTTSIISIEQMFGSLLQIRTICGTLRGVPLWLRVKPITVEPPGSKGGITVYCCHVELRAADIAVIQQNAIEVAKMRRALGGDDGNYGRTLTLPAHDESTEEQGDIANEFYSEDASNVEGGDADTDGDISVPTEENGRFVPSPQDTPPEKPEKAAETAKDKKKGKGRAKAEKPIGEPAVEPETATEAPPHDDDDIPFGNPNTVPSTEPGKDVDGDDDPFALK